MGEQTEVEPPSIAPMGVEDHPVVVSLFRLPSAQVATVDEIDVHAGEADLESAWVPIPVASGRTKTMEPAT